MEKFILFILTVIFCSLVHTQTLDDIRNDIKFGIKEKKLAAIKLFSKFSKKEAEELFSLLISDPDPEIKIAILKESKNLPLNFVLPKILPLLIDTDNNVVQETKNFFIENKSSEQLFNFVQEKIFSSDTELRIVQQLVELLYIFPEKKVLPIIDKIYQKNVFIRYGISALLKNYNDSYTLNILLKYLSDEIPEIRLESVKSLIARKEWQTIPLILPLIKDKHIGKEVNDLLSKIEDKESYTYFFYSIEAYKEKPIKILCISQLGKSKDIKYLPTLIEMYKSEKDNEIKTLLQTAIENYTIQEAENIFISSLYSEKMLNISIPMLVKINSYRSIPYLLNIYPKLTPYLKQQVDNFVSTISEPSLTYFFLSQINNKNVNLKFIINTIVNFDNDLVYDFLEQLILTTKEDKLLELLTSCLVRIKNIEKKVLFTNLIFDKKKRDTEFLQKLLTTMLEIAKTSPDKCSLWIPNLVYVLDHKDQQIKSLSLEILSKILSKDNVEILYSLMENLSLQTQKICFQLILKFPQQKFVAVVKDWFYKTKDPEIKILCCEYVHKIEPFMVEIYYDAIKSDNINLLSYILDIFLEKSSYSDLEKVLPLTLHKTDTIRLKVAKLLFTHATEKEKKYVVLLLKDKNPEIQSLGIKTLNKIAPQEFLEFALQTLNSPYEQVRIESLLQISSVGNVIDEKIKEYIFNLAKKDSSIKVRAEAMKTLAILGIKTVPVINLYFDSLSSYEPELRTASEFCFNKILSGSKEDTEIFIRGLRAEKSYIKRFFINQIGRLKLNRPEINEELKSLLLTSSDLEIINDIRTVFSIILTTKDITLLKEIYIEGNTVLKCWVLKEINKYEYSLEAENILLSALKEQQSIIRETALENSQKYLSSKIVYQTIKYIADNDPEYRIRNLAKKLLSK